MPEHNEWTEDYCVLNHDGSRRQCDNVLELIDCCGNAKELGLKGSGHWIPHVCIKPKPWNFTPSSLKESVFKTVIRHIVKHDEKGETSPFAMLIYDLPANLRRDFWCFGWDYRQVRWILLSRGAQTSAPSSFFNFNDDVDDNIDVNDDDDGDDVVPASPPGFNPVPLKDMSMHAIVDHFKRMTEQEKLNLISSPVAKGIFQLPTALKRELWDFGWKEREIRWIFLTKGDRATSLSPRLKTEASETTDYIKMLYRQLLTEKGFIGDC